jgi:hypothetical protein
MRTKLLAFLSLLLLSAPASAQFIGPPGQISVIDSGTACITAPAACASFTSGTAVSIGLDISGTWTGTLTFEQTSNGSNWRTLWVTNAATGVQVSSTTAGGSWTVANNFIGVRLRATGAMTGLAVVTATRGYGVSTHLFDASVITGTLLAVNGGTGFASYAVGDLLSADTTTTLSKVPAVASGQVLASAGTSTLPAYTATPTVTTATASRTALATTSTDGLIAVNTTAATGGATVQISPRVRWRGTAWDTAASQTVDFFAENLPATAATPTGTWKLGYSLNGAAATYPLTVTSAGGITGVSGGFILSGGAVFTAAAAGFIHNGRTILTSQTDGTENIQNNAGSSGIGIDVNTDAVLKVRVRAQNAYGSVDALAYQASGTAITSGTTHLSAGSGMAVANVGANSCGTSAATIAGNNNAFVITVGATSGTQCRVAFTVTAGTEWDCTVTDSTTTIATRATPVDTTHTDFLGAFVAGDKVTGLCFPR